MKASVAAAFALSFIGSIALGVLTNFANAKIGPEYFASLFGWQGDIVSMSMTQAVLEGSLFGLILGALVAVVYAVRMGSAANVGGAIKLVTMLLACAWAAWILGGVIGVLMGTLSGEWFQNRFDISSERVKGVAWVGGSITGLEVGGTVLTMLILIVFWMTNRRKVPLA